MTAIMKDNVIK